MPISRDREGWAAITIAALFHDRATPELRRLQAEVGSRHSFREAARLIEMRLPCSAQLNTTVRNRLGRVADELGFDEEGQGDADTDAASSALTVFLDGAHIRCGPEYQKRHLDVLVGKVESRNTSRRFGLVQQAAASPARQLRNDLIAQGWDGQSKVTVISDGEPALPNLMRRAVQGLVSHILDWWHISMRVKHIDNAVQGLLQAKGFSGLPLLFERPAKTLRWYVILPQADCGWIGEAGPGPSYGDDVDGAPAGFDNDFTQRNTTMSLCL